MSLMRLSPATRAKIRVEDEHWVWTGSFRQGRPIHAAMDIRPSLWSQLMYPISSGEEVWRTCEESRCVNPDHMEVRASRRSTGST